MKILDNTVPSPCIFGDLPALAVFKCDGNLYMKLPHSFFTDPDEDADEVNAILLITGETIYFGYSESVYRVEATLTAQPFASPSC